MDLDETLDRLHEIWLGLNFDDPTPGDREAFRAYSAELERELKRHPKSSDLWCIKGDWLAETRLLDGASPEPEPRIACYRKAIELDPENGYAYHQLGNVYHLHNRDLNEAVAFFKKAIELGEGPLAHIDLAVAHAQMGRRDLADETLALARQSFGPDPEIDRTAHDIAHGLWDPHPQDAPAPDRSTDA